MTVKVTTLPNFRFSVASMIGGKDLSINVSAAPLSMAARVTPTEARELAAALVLHADRIEPKGDGS